MEIPTGPAEVAATLTLLRTRAGLSQAALAERARTSQPAIARYETGAAVPSWSTLSRILAALGYELRLEAAPVPDPHDVRLAQELLALDPSERLAALARYAAMRDRLEVPA